MAMKLPTDKLYQNGMPVELEQTFSNTPNDCTTLEEQVDWNASVNTAEEAQSVTRRIATIRHYGNASKLLICEHLWQHADDTPFPFLIKETARQAADELTLWGKYLVRIDGGGNVPEELKELYHCLFTEEDSVTTLLGITTLNMITQRSFHELRDEGDLLFNAIAATIADDMDARFEQFIDPYQDVISTRSRAERETMLANMAAYIDIAGHITRHNSVGFPTEKWDGDQRWQRVGTPIQQFYQDIGLTEGIL